MPLQQIIFNLLNNSIKHHNKKSGKIEIGVVENTAHFTFTVSDDGPGIAPEYHKKIFDMFQTLQPRDKVEGSGMGLALVKKILTTYKCDISLNSTPGEGSSFSFTWPKISTTS